MYLFQDLGTVLHHGHRVCDLAPSHLDMASTGEIVIYLAGCIED